MRKTFRSAVFLFSFLGLTSTANALIIDFEEFPILPLDTTGDVISKGFLLDPLSDHRHIFNPDFLPAPANGTNWLSVDDDYGDNPLTISAVDGSAFSLISADLAEFFIGPATNILVTGFYASGGSVSTHIVLDQIVDGPGGLPDFEHFVFGSGWSGLSSVVFDSIVSAPGSSEGWAIDNIRISTIPSPTSLIAFLTGILGIVLLGRGKHRNEVNQGRRLLV